MLFQGEYSSLGIKSSYLCCNSVLNCVFKYICKFSDTLFIKSRPVLGFPGGSVVNNPSANAGDTGLISDPGRFLYTVKQLSPCTTPTEPVLWSPEAATPEAHMPCSPCSTTRETTAMRSPCTVTRGLTLLVPTRESLSRDEDLTETK